MSTPEEQQALPEDIAANAAWPTGTVMTELAGGLYFHPSKGV